MNVAYGVGSSAEQIVVLGPMRAAHDAREGADIDLWVLADGHPLGNLPRAFNRVMVVDGQDHGTMVMNTPSSYYEVSGQFDVPAPVLVINHDQGRVLWRFPAREDHVLYDEATGAVNRLDATPQA